MFELAFDEGTVSWKLNDTTWTPTTTNAQGEPLLDLQEYEVQRTAQRRR
jgi:polyphosphate kinase